MVGACMQVLHALPAYDILPIKECDRTPFSQGDDGSGRTLKAGVREMPPLQTAENGRRDIRRGAVVWQAGNYLTKCSLHLHPRVYSR